MKKARCLFVMLFSLIAVVSASGEIGAYDTFLYSPGEVLGKEAEVLGFTGSWGAGGGAVSQCTIESGSLDYPGTDSAVQLESGKYQVVVPDFEGGRAGRFLALDPNDTFADYADENGNIGEDGNTLYISFLMKTSHVTPFFAFELKRDDLGDNGGILYIGNDMNETIQVCAFRDRNTDPSNIGVHLNYLGDATTDTELYVVRIDFQAGGDDVTVYRQPSLDAEPSKAPDLLNAGDLAFDGISMAAWVGPGGRTAQFDEICIGSTYNDVVRFYEKPSRAQNPSPADGIDDISAGSVTLSWDGGTGVSNNSFEVYCSDDLNAVVAESASAFKGSTSSTSMAISGLNTDTTYYWSITETRDDPNYIPGAVWTFETEKTLPDVIAQPESQMVFAGSDVEFFFNVNSQTTASYQWYGSDGIITDGGNISGSQTATLAISGVQASDEDVYYCEVVNNAGMVTSDSAELLIKRLVGYWDLDQADSAELWMDNSESENDLQVVYTDPGSYTWAQGADGAANGALVFDGQFALGTKKDDGTMNDIPVGNEAYTISLWFKTTPKNEGFIGWGNYGNYNQCNAIAIYSGNTYEVNNYWWDNDLRASRGYNLADDSWHHLVSTYDSTNRAIYIDGIKAATATPAPHDVQSSVNFLIGKTNETSPDVEFFVGALDDVQVYNYAITATDVADMYTQFSGSSLCVSKPEYDYNDDCKVDLADMAYFMGQWLECGVFPTCITTVE